MLPQASVSKRGEVQSHWYENDFYSHANTIHFHEKDFALSLVLKVRAFGTRKMSTGHCEVAGETGSVLCRIALWDYFRDAIAFFIGCC